MKKFNLMTRWRELRQNRPERIAWLILNVTFGIFCLLAVLVPSSLYWYLVNATQPFNPEITSVRGTVLLNNPNIQFSSSLADGNSTTIEENSSISTDNTSQAILNFADDSSLTMYSNTRLNLLESHEPQFGVSPNPGKITVQLQQGRVRATVSRGRSEVNFNIDTPYASIQLDQGSFSVDVDEYGEAQVTARLGQAVIIHNNQETITLKQDKRAVVNDSSILAPLPSSKNLLTSSYFEPNFTEVWEVYKIEPIEGVTTTVKVDAFGGRQVLVLRSQGQDNVHTETGVIQQVNKDVRDFQSLRVFAEVQPVKQSLPGGGQLGSEFPIMLHVAYKDANNNDRDWFHGFYYDPPPDNYILYSQPDNSSERVPRYIWYPYESVNLLTTLGPAKPVFIKSIRIYASGWIYEAAVANISLLAQE